MSPQDQLAGAVIQLHDIARTVEQIVGSGQLSEDIRAAADRLHVLTQPIGQSKKGE